MPTQSVSIQTFKEGVLSPIAHDLRISATASVERDGARVIARISASGLRVVGAMRGGQVDAALLSAANRMEIEANIRDRVLEAARYPEICFVGDESGNGELTLHGRTLPIAMVAGKVEIIPSRWGIAPFRAMMGALRVQDRVGIELA